MKPKLEKEKKLSDKNSAGVEIPGNSVKTRTIRNLFRDASLCAKRKILIVLEVLLILKVICLSLYKNLNVVRYCNS